MDRMERKRQERIEREQGTLDSALAEILFNAAKGDDVPRIVRVPLVNIHQAYELAGNLFPDDMTRCAVNPRAKVDEAATIAKMDRMDQERRNGR